MSKRFFKCMPSKYADKFVSQGVLRIGTAHGYRAIEDAEIGDPGEGTLSQTILFPDVSIATHGTPITFQQGIPRQRPLVEFRNVGGDIRLENNTHIDIYDYDDVYLFCFTDTYPTPEFLREIGYDSAVEILNIEKFADLLGERLRHIGLVTNVREHQPQNLGLRKVIGKLDRCKYNGRELNGAPTQSRDPYFQKEQRHAYQEEMRIVFPTYNGARNLQACNIMCQDIAPLCVRIV